MSIATPIQWTDDTVNPVMGCDAPRELRPSPAKAAETTLRFFRDAFPGFDQVQMAGWIDGIIAGRNATEIYQLRDRTVDAVVHGAGGSPTTAVSLRKGYKAALDEIFICYAHQQTMMRGSDITNPHKRTTPGFPVQFEILKKFPGRMAEAAMRPDLYGKVRPGKPWLDYLPRAFFVSDMADALSPEIDFDYLKAEIIDVVASARGRQHLWLWLTKMPWRMAEFAAWLKSDHHQDWPANLVAMTSVTSAKTVVRAKQLLEVPVRFRGLSVEPLWGEVDLPLAGIDWCIVGGQSGPGAKPFNVVWLRSLQAQCKTAGSALFVKQLGALPEREGKRIKLADEHGGDWNEWPVDLRIREMPAGFRRLRIDQAALANDTSESGGHANDRPCTEQILSAPDGRSKYRIEESITPSAETDSVHRTDNATCAVTPQRVQMRRSKGWHKPVNTVYVGRPGKFGNPFSIEEDGRDEAIRRYEAWILVLHQGRMVG